MPTDHSLPPDITEGATLRGNEFGWHVSLFPNALAKAQVAGYACLGGRFQFRLDDGTTCEMYWLEADATERVVANVGKIILGVLVQRFSGSFNI